MNVEMVLGLLDSKDFKKELVEYVKSKLSVAGLVDNMDALSDENVLDDMRDKGICFRYTEGDGGYDVNDCYDVYVVGYKGDNIIVSSADNLDMGELSIGGLDMSELTELGRTLFYAYGGNMNYKDIIEKAAVKRDQRERAEKEKRDNQVLYYVTCIKDLAGRIRELLAIEKELVRNNFDIDKLCTDSMYHRLGFAKGKNGIGIYGGGACGDFNLIVSENGVPLMYGRNCRREPNYNDLWYLKKFVEGFGKFEATVKQFVLDL